MPLARKFKLWYLGVHVTVFAYIAASFAFVILPVGTIENISGEWLEVWLWDRFAIMTGVIAAIFGAVAAILEEAERRGRLPATCVEGAYEAPAILASILFGFAIFFFWLPFVT